ncbi:MAG: hypothetical protein AB7P32_02415 [Nitrospirales bacterium]
MTSGPVKPLSSLIIVLYLTLMSVGTFCLSSHDLHHSPINHHSQNQISHSLLCSWACQVSSKANAADTTQRALISLPFLLAGLLFLITLIPTQATLIPTSARGPPASFVFA